MSAESKSAPAAILAREPLGRPWRGIDPFLFCMFHEDSFPAGNGELGPAPTTRADREPGQDFSGRDGWNMYHGERVPGFPGHPHRGFETVTIVLRGLVDHADSLGAAARYGNGDVQWLTAGRGVQHAEMFPLVATDADNPLALFQIWLNLPAARKMAPAAFRMLWEPAIPKIVSENDDGRSTEVIVVAGAWRPIGAPPTDVVEPVPPPPDSWASDPAADVAIWLLRLDPGTTLTLPAARSPDARRALYFHGGQQLAIDGETVAAGQRLECRVDRPLTLVNTGTEVADLLMLQGRPIGEPVAAHGPFVMNTEQELVEAVRDYSRTRFGGWPWPSQEPTHGQAGRFARHPDGRTETPAGGAS